MEFTARVSGQPELPRPFPAAVPLSEGKEYLLPAFYSVFFLGQKESEVLSTPGYHPAVVLRILR